MQRILFLTGRLAEPALRATLERLAPGRFGWEVRQPGVQVAALMTAGSVAAILVLFRRVAAKRKVMGTVASIIRHDPLNVVEVGIQLTGRWAGQGFWKAYTRKRWLGSWARRV